MSARIFSKHRFVKVIRTDQHGLPTEEIVRLPRYRFRSLLLKVLPLQFIRLLGLTRPNAQRIINM